jgi:predicted ATPase/class 3 adenylate cyclase
VEAGQHAFLFTDIAGSTRLWEEQPDAMSEALEHHDSILRLAVEGHAGDLFATMGDGIAAAFRAVDDAVATAAQIKHGLHANDWGVTGELRVRMGIHVGPAQRRGADYFGATLNRCARLMAVAHGGQVLLSGAAHEALGDGDVLDLGVHRLRDLAVPEHVFQLAGFGDDADFPALLSLDLRPGNLPLQTTSFVSRDEDMAAVVDAMARSRVVTITGVGGVGKTRLALQSAAEASPGFTDGAWLCELASLGDAVSVPHAVASLFGVQQEAGRSLTESLAVRLRASSALLVLDNCEHVLGAVSALVEEISRGCAGIVVLATSREPLNVTGELVRTVGALDLGGSVQLFADRASAVRPDFDLTVDNEAAVTELCRRLEGVPLAVELAAARVTSMSPAEIEQRLGERFRLLTGGRRTALERQRTLRGTVDWSFDLLDGPEQRVFSRLAVFSGGFTLASAEVVAAGSTDAQDVVDALDSLVRKSMVSADVHGGVTRYSMLETLRQYAEEKLGALGESDDARRRHAVHFAQLAEEGDVATRGSEEVVWVPRLTVERDNFRAALEWAVDLEEPLLAAQLASGLAVFASFHMWSEFDRWARDAMETTQANSSTVPNALAGRLYALSAEHARFAGEVERAAALVEHGLSLGGLDDEALFWLHNASSNVRLARGDLESAIAADEAAVAAAERSREAWALAMSLAHLSLSLSAANQPARARELAERGLDAARRSGAPTLISYGAFAVGESGLDGDPDDAVGWLQEAADAARSVDNQFMLGLVELSLVSALGRSDEPHRAAAGYLDLLAHWEATANQHQRRVTIRNASDLLARCGRFDVATVVHGAMRARAYEAPGGSPEANRLVEAMASARDALGDDFERHVERGTQISDDELIALVRDALQQLETP